MVDNFSNTSDDYNTELGIVQDATKKLKNVPPFSNLGYLLALIFSVIWICFNDKNDWDMAGALLILLSTLVSAAALQRILSRQSIIQNIDATKGIFIFDHYKEYKVGTRDFRFSKIRKLHLEAESIWRKQIQKIIIFEMVLVCVGTAVWGFSDYFV